MPFVLVLPLIVIGIVIAATKKAAEQNKRAEAQRRAEQMQTRQTASTAKQYTPARPSVQIPTVREAAPTLKPTPTQRPQNKAYQSATSKAHPQHDDCSLRPDSKAAPTPPWQHPQHEGCSLDNDTASNPAAYSLRKPNPALQTNGTTLDFTPDNIVRGVLFSEIFGKPKALR